MLGVAVALTGCGNRVSAKPDPAAQGAAAPEVAHLMPQMPGRATALIVGRSTCDLNATLADPYYVFTMSKADYARVTAGTRFVLAGRHARMSGYRATGAPPGVPISATEQVVGQVTKTPITGGSVTFDTFEAGKAATGTYEVVFPGGTASGTFSADFCPPLLEAVKSLPPPPPVEQPAL